MDEEDYYVIYDMDDNIICLCVGLKELAHCISRKAKHLKFRFKNKNFIYFVCANTYFKIFKFTDNSDIDILCKR